MLDFCKITSTVAQPEGHDISDSWHWVLSLTHLGLTVGDFGSKYSSARYIVRSGNPKGKRTKRSTLGLETYGKAICRGFEVLQ